MAPTKRARPSFSPPRPGKSKTKGSTATKKATASKSKSNGLSKSKDHYKGKKGTRAAFLGSEEEDDDEDDADNDADPRLARKKQSLLDNEASEDEDDEDEDMKEDLTTSRRRAQNNDPPSSPEPDMILAEITHNPSASSQTPIPIPLIHKILQHHFADKDKTTISMDAREVLGKYIEVFVREAIARCVFERREAEGGSGGGGGIGGGFLEVEDLERAAVQLCLDF